MAILQAIFALISRSLGRITSAIFGWAVVALFGQTSDREKVLLSALVGAAAAWPILLLGIAVPKIATFVLAFVPLPEWVPSWTVRVVWIVLAAAVPFAVGATLAARQRRAPAGPQLADGSARAVPRAPLPRESAVKRLLRGFPITVGIAAAFLVEFATVPALRVGSILRRRVDVQVPLVTDARNYDAVAAEVAATLNAHAFTVEKARPGWWMTVPSRILLRLGGPAFRDYIPERLAYFRGPRLEVALYPNGLLLRGSEQDTAWAHGLVVEALTAAPAFQTFDPAAQDIERQIRRIWTVYRENPRAHGKSAVLLGRLADIARDIGQLPVDYDEWQIVYRQAMQLGRALQGDRQLLDATAAEGDRASTALEEEGMATVRDGSARSLSSRALISEITTKASLLVKKEVDLARAEIRADLKSELAMVKTLGVAVVAALMGLNVLLVAGVLALATIIPGWAAGLIVGGGVLAIAAIVGYVGWTRRVTTPLPMTRQTLKEDMQWVKERVA
jgi:hypothetical protein